MMFEANIQFSKSFTKSLRGIYSTSASLIDALIIAPSHLIKAL